MAMLKADRNAAPSERGAAAGEPAEPLSKLRAFTAANSQATRGKPAESMPESDAALAQAGDEAVMPADAQERRSAAAMADGRSGQRAAGGGARRLVSINTRPAKQEQAGAASSGEKRTVRSGRGSAASVGSAGDRHTLAAMAARQERGGKLEGPGDDSSRDSDAGEDESGKPLFAMRPFLANGPAPSVPVQAAGAPALPSAEMQRLIEYSSVCRNQSGVYEFHLGLNAGVLGGMRVCISAFGRGRIGLKITRGRGGRKGELDAEIRALIGNLSEAGLEVVETIIA